MDLQGVQHAFPGDDDLLGLFFHWQRTDQGSHFLGCLPLSQLKGEKKPDDVYYQFGLEYTYNSTSYLKILHGAVIT